ncbi:MAG: hypothetical protein HY287_08090 [Planctomycetes bacterium]|nr:hypothetical protein [Planctomycetota bacterium]
MKPTRSYSNFPAAKFLRRFGVLLAIASLGGCRNGGEHSLFHSKRNAKRENVSVFCLYEAKCWLNLDSAGDPDPEGIQYRVYLDPGTGRGAYREGTFHVEMYRIDSAERRDNAKRTLVSDWHYPTSEFRQLHSSILGDGYHLELRWGDKEIPGHDIEIITQFEDPHGNVTRSATKILRVPKYGA